MKSRYPSIPCCGRIGERTRYISRGRKMSLCSKCLEVMLHEENHGGRLPEGDDNLSRLASYYTP